jgi:hypothetical protein
MNRRHFARNLRRAPDQLAAPRLRNRRSKHSSPRGETKERRHEGGLVACVDVHCGGGAVWRLALRRAGPVTFTKDVAPIFQDKCESCHRPESMAPMSLVTYEAARPWAKSIAARVASRQMPPWHIDKTVDIQKFKNDRSLSDAQIETIQRWVEAGAPKGDLKDMPAPKQWPDESKWQLAAKLGQPDLSCARTRASSTSRRICTCAARACRWKRSSRTAAARC